MRPSFFLRDSELPTKEVHLHCVFSVDLYRAVSFVAFQEDSSIKAVLQKAFADYVLRYERENAPLGLPDQIVEAAMAYYTRSQPTNSDSDDSSRTINENEKG